MAIAFGQRAGTQVDSGGTVTATLGSFPQNHLAIACFRYNTVGGTVTPPANWSFAGSIAFPGTGPTEEHWYRVGGAGEPTGITFQHSDTLVQLNLEVIRFSGTDITQATVLDKVGVGNTGTSVTSLSTGTSGILTYSDEVLIAGVAQSGGNGGSEAVDSGFTASGFATHARATHAWKIVAVTTAENPIFSWANSLNAAGIITTYRAPQPVTVGLTPAILTLAGEAVAPDPQPVVIALVSASLVLTAEPITPTIPNTTTLTTAVITFTAVSISVTPGAVTVNLVAASFVLTATTLFPLSIFVDLYPKNIRFRDPVVLKLHSGNLVHP